MADALDSFASPRLNKRHQRYARFARARHSKQQLSWLQEQATRLGTSPAAIFALLDTHSRNEIFHAVSLVALGLVVDEGH
jgi:hypothetical protein